MACANVRVKILLLSGLGAIGCLGSHEAFRGAGPLDAVARVRAADGEVALLKMLEDSDPAVRYWACVRLSEVGCSGEGIDAVSRLLVDQGRWAGRRPLVTGGELVVGRVSDGAGYTLRAILARARLPELRQRALSYQHDPAAAAIAIEALGSIPVHESIAALASVARSAPGGLADQAVSALSRIIERHWCIGIGREAWEALASLADMPSGASRKAAISVDLFAREAAALSHSAFKMGNGH